MPKYNIASEIENTEDCKEYEINEPDPNVIPKINWGALRNLFVNGYNIINSAKNIEILTVKELVNISNEVDKIPNNIKNNHASIMEIEPFARGLFKVLDTCLSILESLISFITQPHDLTNIEPIITIK